jgi:hypothetical protein
LENDFVLRVCLESGDYVDFYTDEEPYESAFIDFGLTDGVQDSDIY